MELRNQHSGVSMQLSDAEDKITQHVKAKCWADPAQSETLSTWRRPLYGTWEISSVPEDGTSGRFMKGNTRR